MDPLKGDNSRRGQWALEREIQEVKAHLEFEISYFSSKMFFSLFQVDKTKFHHCCFLVKNRSDARNVDCIVFRQLTFFLDI